VLGLGALGITTAGTPVGGGPRTLAYRHLCGGGDGVRMTTMLDQLASEHHDMTVHPYAKLSLAAWAARPRRGDRARHPADGLLEPFGDDLLDRHGIGQDRFRPDAWKLGRFNGRQYATHETLAASKTVFGDGQILRWWFTSLLTASLITAGTIITASLAAFAFSRIRFRGSNVLQWLVLAGLIVPFLALIVPLFQEVDSFGLADIYWGVILPQVAAPVAVLVFKRAFAALPSELEESALIDGASPWRRVYWQIWLPLSRSTIAAVGIFTFVVAWNNFIWPFVSTSGAGLMTVPVGLATVNTGYGALYAQQMALAILGALALPVVFVLFQRQIVQGIANTGLKG
jgi:multiple sugar transport system permease protein